MLLFLLPNYYTLCLRRRRRRRLPDFLLPAKRGDGRGKLDHDRVGRAKEILLHFPSPTDRPTKLPSLALANAQTFGPTLILSGDDGQRDI